MNDYTVTIEKVIRESYDTVTLAFGWDAEVRPGQFVMVWVPGIDEIPMSVSGINGRTKSITVKAIGEATNALHTLSAGDRMRIRGPYGNGFDLSCGEMLIIGGGVGTAAVISATVQTGSDMIIAARSEKDIIMSDIASRYSKNLRIATDDGSAGFRGNAVQLMKEMVSAKHYDCIIACGPEVMLYYTYKACEELGLECQLSLERYMKCGAGVCGCCVMDDMRVCKDGPVFTKQQISELSEFGKSKRDACGRLISMR
ncbi:MAG: dihydroorotate dehydrogenase electron transfer subunit [Candidatus Methanomethylophilaceae archaeon]|nr:dihydroorotate dehydrogenase electron transfer subunit [Candidatus Methanomethylophilaceae archaeon]